MGRQVNALDQPYKEVALALYDPELDSQSQATAAGSRLDKGAYYYPIGVKMQLTPKRNKNLANLGLQKKAVDEELERPDEIDLVLQDPDEEEIEKRKGHRAELTADTVVINGT